MAEKILEKNVLESYKEGSILYAIEVNRQRAVPDVRDSLKPVARRIIDVMLYNAHCDKRQVKSANIVGTVIAKSHPHSDTAVYDAMKIMTNWFDIKEPFIEGHGNWGTMQGAQQAAMRYTECRLSEFAIDVLISDMMTNKNVVDWKNTFDNMAKEPECFAAALPLLLIQGTFGIAYGLKVEIPPHNLAEVIDATLELIKNPNATISLIPDECMPVHIFDTDWKEIANTGSGSYISRGIIDIEQIRGKTCLVIKSTPNMVYLDTIIEKIEDMIGKKEIIHISNWYDDSKGNNMKYVIELKSNCDPNYIRDIIYKKTSMESRHTINFLALDGPVKLDRYSYKSYLLSWLEFRKLTKFKLYCNKLKDVETEYHRKDTFVNLMTSGRIDEVINHIRKNRSTIGKQAVIDWLCREFNISPLQANYIASVEVYKLAESNTPEYIKDRDALAAERDRIFNIIVNDQYIFDEIIEELKYFKKKYGKPRICKVIDAKELNNIPAGEFKIAISEKNFIKKVPAEAAIGGFRNDPIKSAVKGDNRQSILLFDDQGRAYKLPIHKIPIGDKYNAGIDIRLLNNKIMANITSIFYDQYIIDLSKKIQKYFMVVVTRKGLIKKMDLDDFVNTPLSGLVYMKLDEDDSVASIKIVHEALDVIVYSDNKAIRLPLSIIPYQKRQTKGVKSLNTDEIIDGMSVINTDTTDIVVVTLNGRINKFNVSGLPQAQRNQAGSRVIKLGATDKIYSILSVNDNDLINIFTTENPIGEPIRVLDIESSSSISAGRKISSIKNVALGVTSGQIIRVEVKKRNRA